MRKAKAIYSKLAIAKQSATITLHLAGTQRQTGVGKFYSEKKEDLRYALAAGCFSGKAVGGLTRSRHPM